MELKQGNTYIFVKKDVSYTQTPFKGKVEEVTDTTYLIHNLDNNVTTRYQRERFDSDYKTLETTSTKDEEVKKLMGMMEDTKPQIVYGCPNRPGPCYCTGACMSSPTFFDLSNDYKYR